MSGISKFIFVIGRNWSTSNMKIVKSNIAWHSKVHIYSSKLAILHKWQYLKFWDLGMFR